MVYAQNDWTDTSITKKTPPPPPPSTETDAAQPVELRQPSDPGQRPSQLGRGHPGPGRQAVPGSLRSRFVVAGDPHRVLL